MVATAGSALSANGVVYSMLGKLTAEEWKEVVPGVGTRTILSRAAAELHDAHVGSELDALYSLRDAHEKMKAQLDQVAAMNGRYEDNARRVQETISAQMSLILNASSQRDGLKVDAADAANERSRLGRDVASLKVERDSLQKEHGVALAEAAAAEKQALALASYASGK